MRPIRTDSQAAGYDEDAILDETVATRRSRADTVKPPRKRQAVAMSKERSEILDEIEGILTESYNPVSQIWADDLARRQADRLIEKAGTDYRSATRDLIAQTGGYCAFCDSPVSSDLAATPVLPLRWFPTLAFRFENLALICPACDEARGAEPYPNPTRGTLTADQLLQPDTYAWPQFYWNGLPDGTPFPLAYSLWEVRRGGLRTEPLRRLSQEEADWVAFLWRLGRAREQGRYGDIQVFEEGRVPYVVAARVEPAFPDSPIAPGLRAMIAMFGLNETTVWDFPYSLDRRLGLRTLCFLRATDLRRRRDAAAVDAFLRDKLDGELTRIIPASGFFGVWLSVFRDRPAVQPVLRGLFPGTAGPNWAI